jgi:MtrB/PioB family decaheme-associated outer membrane protein
MKKTILFSICAAFVLAAAPSFAQGPVYSGYVAPGLRTVDEDNDSAKFMEYRDLDDGLYGNALIGMEQGNYHIEAEGKNIGRDDQSYTIDGGNYSGLSYSLFYDSIIHNLSFGAQTFYNGLGSDSLTHGGSVPAVSTWSEFDYDIKRERYGVSGEYSFSVPLTLSIGASSQKTKGLKPLGTGGFGGSIEIPAPVDYTTDNFSLGLHYRFQDLLISVDGKFVDFDNDNNFVNWMDRSGNTDLNPLAPDNEYWKIAAQAVWKNLPVKSHLAARLGYSKLENDYSTSTINFPLASHPAGLNTTDFNGEIKTLDGSFQVTSRPVENLDTKVFYRFLDKDNKSDVISYGSGAGFTTNDTHLFDYNKNNGGIEARYRLSRTNRLKGGYEYRNIDRHNRLDAEETTDHIIDLQLKNNTVDFLEVKVGYRHVERSSDFALGSEGDVNTDAEYIERFVRRFDDTDKTMEEAKIGFDIYVMDDLDLGLEYAYRDNDYDETTLGRTGDTRHAVYFDLAYRLPVHIVLSGFGGYEVTKADSRHYVFRAGNGTPPQTADPTVEDGNPASYIWTQDVNDKYWTYGVSVDVPLMNDRLHLNAKWEQQDSDGEVKFTSGGTPALEDIEESDDYAKKLFELKGTYSFTNNVAVTLGYLYEKYKLNDLQFQGYVFNEGNNYLSGAYTDHDYEANVGYVLLTYNL